MKFIPLILIVFLLLSSCQEIGDSDKTNIVKQEVNHENVVPTALASFGVTGMMCQKGCGATVRKGLYETGGVNKVEVELGDSISQVFVYYDEEKIAPKEMEKAIGNLIDGRYQAHLTAIKEIEN